MDKLDQEVNQVLAGVTELMQEAQQKLATIHDVRSKYLKQAKAKLAKAEERKQAEIEKLKNLGDNETPIQGFLVLAGALAEKTKLGFVVGRTSWGLVCQPSNGWITKERAHILLTANRVGDTDLGKDFLDLNQNEWVNLYSFMFDVDGQTLLNGSIQQAEKELKELDASLQSYELPTIAAVQNTSIIAPDLKRHAEGLKNSGGIHPKARFITGDHNKLNVVGF